MSHFKVAVFCKDVKDVEKLLAPYQENNMGDCPKEYLAFNNIGVEYLEEYENKTLDKVVLSDGTLVDTYDKQFKKYVSKEEYDKNKGGGSEGWGENAKYFILERIWQNSIKIQG